MDIKIKNNLSLFLKGILIGTGNVFPGVSGGTIALLLGIYSDLINAIKSINIKYLLPIGAGAGIAILIGSRIIPSLLDNYLAETSAFFLGLILASVKVPLKHIERKSWRELVAALIGLSVSFLLVGISLSHRNTSLVFTFFAGFLAICTMILPGISGSSILILLGQYKNILEAVRDFNLPVIIIFSSGMIIGLFLFVRFLSYMLEKYHSVTMAILTGFMLGSLRAVWPGEFSISIVLTFTLGVGIILALEYSGGKKKAT